jgi:hypothetical protein
MASSSAVFIALSLKLKTQSNVTRFDGQAKLIFY